MSDKRSIKAAFARANLPLKISERTLNRNLIRGSVMVEMAITNTSRGETISMVVPDDESIDVRVIGGDPDLQQVVVMVKEPPRTFTERTYDWRTRTYVERTRKVPEEKRKFLVGMDECHLFIAQMDGGAKGTSVKQIHKDLRPREVPEPKKAKKLKIKRTGEYFLIPITETERSMINDHIKTFGPQKKVGLGTGRGRGRPHIVSEKVNVRGLEFARGRILHPDHRVVKLKDWHRVVVNTEDRSVGAQWVD